MPLIRKARKSTNQEDARIAAIGQQPKITLCLEDLAIATTRMERGINLKWMNPRSWGKYRSKGLLSACHQGRKDLLQRNTGDDRELVAHRIGQDELVAVDE